MSELRWIILGIGILFIAAVYFFGRRSSGDEADDDVPAGLAGGSRIEPSVALSEAPLPPLEPDTDVPEPAAEAAPEPVELSDERVPAERVIMLHLVSRSGLDFEAPEVVAALRAQGLRFGAHDMFHRYLDEGNPGPDSQPQFTVANMLRPGSFKLDELQDQRLRGISLFLGLPGPDDPVAAFADMLGTGKRLAATLDAQLVDETGAHMTQQNSEHMREEIVAFQLAQRVPAD